MPTDEIIIRLFCMVDDQLGRVNKRSDAHLYPSEIVTIELLFHLKGGWFHAFSRWLSAHYRALFPALPERTRMPRLLRDHAEDVLSFLAEPTFFTVVDTYGIELIHPRREGCSPKQIGRKGISNGRWIVGIKLAWLINDAGEVVDWSWDTANEPDNVFRPLATGYDGQTIALADLGLRAKDTPTQNIKCCEKGSWNERLTIETNLSWVTELIQDLMLRSPEFRAWWPDHEVLGAEEGQNTFNHPQAGYLMFEHLTFQVFDAPDLKVNVYTPLDIAGTPAKLSQLLSERASVESGF